MTVVINRKKYKDMSCSEAVEKAVEILDRDYFDIILEIDSKNSIQFFKEFGRISISKNDEGIVSFLNDLNENSDIPGLIRAYYDKPANVQFDWDESISIEKKSKKTETKSLAASRDYNKYMMLSSIGKSCFFCILILNLILMLFFILKRNSGSLYERITWFFTELKFKRSDPRLTLLLCPGFLFLWAYGKVKVMELKKRKNPAP